MDKRFEAQESILVKGIRSAMAVPLWDENKVVGVLYADAHHSSNHWTEEGEEDLSFFSALANLVASSVQRWLLTQKLRSEEMIRQRLERYHSPAVVQQLIALGALPDGRLPPAEGEISILFADIVGFTALSERLSPVQISQLLNSLFEEMLQEVFAVGGTLDKYIGDCIMAFFGAPEPQQDHADRAVVAAMGMLSRLEKLNASLVLGEPLQLRIAINSGKAVIGDVGSSQRVDYTALGGTINLASRMEAICPPGECIVSEATYTILTQKQGLEEMGEYRFKGIDRPVGVYKTKRH
jgi:adenylate cyclase